MTENEKSLRAALDAVNKAKDTVATARNEADRKFIVANIGKDLVQLLAPLLQQIAENARITKSEMSDIIKQIKVESPNVNVEPAQIKVDAKVPDVIIPEIKFPKDELIKAIKEAAKSIKFPKPEKMAPWEFPKEMKVAKMEELIGNVEKLVNAKLSLDMGGISRDNPLPVILTDEDGKFYKAMMTAVSGGGAGVGSLIGYLEDNGLSVYVAGATGTLAVNIVDSTGKAYTGSNPLTIQGTVAVSGVTGSIAATLIDSSGIGYSGSNPVPVTGTFAPGATYFASQAIGSTNIIQVKGVAINTDQGYSYPATLRVVHATDVGVSVNLITALTSVIDSIGTRQVSGAVDSVYITGASGSIAATLVDSSGVGYSGSNPLPVAGTFTGGATYFASQAIGSTNIIQVKGVAINTDQGYSYPATLRVVHATDVALSTKITEAVSGLSIGVKQVSGAADSVNVLTMPAVVVTSVTNSIAANIVDSSGVAYSTSNPVPIDDAGGIITVDGTVVVSSVTASIAASLISSAGVGYSGSNPVPIKVISVSGVTGSLGVNINDSSGVGYSGSNPVPTKLISVTGVTGSLAATIIDSSGVGYSTSNPLPVDDAGGILTVDGTVVVSSVTASTAVTLISSAGVGYSGSNPLPITGAITVNGATNSMIAVGPVRSDVADDGSAPVKTGGIARTANPTAVGAGDTVSGTYDDLGRQVMKIHQVRDCIATAYVSLTGGTETTLLAAVAGYYNDLIYIMGSNTSTVAATVSIRPRTGGNIVMTLRIPANGTTGVSLPVAIPQGSTDYTGNNWTVDMDDISGTTVYISALFSKEV